MVEKESRFLRRFTSTSLDPARALVQVFLALGLGVWLVVDPGQAGRVLTAGLAVIVLLTAWSNYRDLEPKRKKGRDRLLFLGTTVLAVIMLVVPAYLAAPAGVLFGICFLVLGLVRGLCAVECWRRDLPGKFRHSLAFLVSLVFGVLLFLHPVTRLSSVAVLSGIYLLVYAGLLLLDGAAEWLLRWRGHTGARRRVRVALPIFLAALLPGRLVDDFNEYFRTRDDEAPLPEFSVQRGQAQAEVFIHLVSKGMGRTGHVDFRLGDTVYSYGCYDHHAHRLFGMISDGTLAIAPVEPYRRHCLSFERKILIGFGLHLTPDQEEKVKQTLHELLSKTEPWMSDAEKMEKGLIPQEPKRPHDAASLLWRATGAEIRKVKEGPFATYFALNTNCVQLADTILGPTGLDILAVNGIPTPGSYYAMLNRQFERGSSTVVSRTVYAGRLSSGARPRREKRSFSS